MTEQTRYGMYYDEVHGVLVLSKHEADWEPRDYELEIDEDEVSNHVHLDKWTSRRAVRFSQRDQGFPQLMALMVNASEDGKVRI